MSGDDVPPHRTELWNGTVQYRCKECDNTDGKQFSIIAEGYSWVVECMVCGHPNDAPCDGD